MVTLAVAIILAMLAVPNFRDLIDKSRLRGATDGIVNLLNHARASAVKLERPVSVSINAISASSWCAGAISAPDPTVGSGASATVDACDCSIAATDTGACFLGGTANGQYTVIQSADFSGATISGTDDKITYDKGITFNSKFGALDLGNLPGAPLVTVLSPTKRYSTQITISPLGQVNACSVGGKFISGYPSC